MKFHRVDENTVRCTLTEEDMLEYGLRLEDFFTNKDKTRGFLEKIVKQAQEEVGYETNGETLAMQVMPLPQNGLSITLTEQSEQSIKSVLGHLQSALGDLHPDEVGDMIEELYSEAKEAEADKNTSSKSEHNKQEEKRKEIFLRVFCFESMNAVEAFAAMVPENINVKSTLYKNEEDAKYYLVIEKGRVAVKNLEKICLCANEYAKLVSKRDTYVEYCKEHYTCLMKKGAIKILRQLAC